MGVRRDEITVQKGQAITARQHNNVAKLAESLTLNTRGIPGRRGPNGFTPTIKVSTSISAKHAFKLALVAGQNGELGLTFTPAHVAGVMPTIGDRGLDELDDAGVGPVLEVKDDAWLAKGKGERALVMFRYDLDHTDFSVTKVTPLAVKAVPASAPWTWHKLVAILTRQNGDVKIWPQMFFPQAFEVTDTTATGRFTPWPRAEA